MKVASPNGPCISIPLEREGGGGDGRRGTATRRHRRTVLFRFAGAGRGNFIDFERDSGALSFFFFTASSGISAARKLAALRSGEIKIRTGCLLFRASATLAIVPNSIFLIPFVVWLVFVTG